MKRFASLSLGCLCLIALFAVTSRADDTATMEAPKAAAKGATIKAEDAKDNVGNEVVVEFVVVGGRELEDKGIAFLNSSNDQNDPNSFTAFITKSGMTKLKSEGNIEHPSDHFNGKKVQVSGKIKKYKDKAEIEINSPSQIKIVEEESAAPKG